MNTIVARYGPLAGRLLLAFMFIFSGWGKIGSYAGTAGYMASKGLPFPELLLPFVIAVELGGGILLVIGWHTRLAALALFVLTFVAALIFHNFWAVPPEQAQNQMIHFMKNVTIMGGMMYVMAFGAGPLSLDHRSESSGGRLRQ